MRLDQLTLPQRLLAGLGCVVVLACFGIGVVVAVWEVRANLSRDRERHEAPAGWTDSLRAFGRLPDLAGLVPATTDTGDGAWVVYDSARAWRVAGIEHAYRARIGAMAPDASDSAMWRAIWSDTTLDAFAGAARAASWRATDRMLAMAPAAAQRNLLQLPTPRFNGVRDAARALVIRGLMRQQHGNRDGARADLAAATGLGFQMIRREPGYLGFLVGRATLASGLHGWLAYATAAHDSALAMRAEGLRAAYGGRPMVGGYLLMDEPDSAIAIMQGGDLAPGLRLFALEQTLASSTLRPTGILFGPPRRVRAAIRGLTQDPDPNVARMAAIADRTAARMNAFGLVGLLREMR